MRSHSRVVIGSVVGVGILMTFILGFHLGGAGVLKVGLYSQLIGAFIGGTLAILSVNTPFPKGENEGENAEPWLGRERWAWTLIGAGCIMWGIGECFWRYFLSIGQNPFPSAADFGYSSLPILVFLGLILQPSSGTGRRRILVLLDSLISMGAILAIAWFLLLGSLAQAPGEANLAKFLGLYYPTTDMALLSCVVFLLLRGQGRVYQVTARRVSLLVLGVGLCIFATSDFIFNIQQNAGTYVDGTWVDLGWPLGMMTIGVAAYLRRFLPATSGEAIEERVRRRSERFVFGPAQSIPYVLLAVLFTLLVVNALSTESGQPSIRPVLIIATMIVVALVVVRQIITMLDNERLVREQATTLEQLEMVNQRIAEHSAELEAGITHLKEIQTRLANGDVHARARLTSGELWPLTRGLNLMADRMMHSEQIRIYAQRLVKALTDLSITLEHHTVGNRFVLPASCYDFSEINRLVLAMSFKQTFATSWPTSPPLPPEPVRPSVTPIPDTSASLSQRPPSIPLNVPLRESIKQQRHAPEPLQKNVRNTDNEPRER